MRADGMVNRRTHGIDSNERDMDLNKCIVCGYICDPLTDNPAGGIPSVLCSPTFRMTGSARNAVQEKAGLSILRL